MNIAARIALAKGFIRFAFLHFAFSPFAFSPFD
jgi:hypothetical protein